MDADVQEAADRSARNREQRRGRDVHRGTGGISRFSSGAAAGSVGSGHSAESSADADLARIRISVYGVPDGSSGSPRIAPAAASWSHDCGRHACPLHVSRRDALQHVNLIERVELCQPELRRPPQPVAFLCSDRSASTRLVTPADRRRASA